MSSLPPALLPAEPIPRIPEPPLEDFARDWLRPARPVILTGAITGWRALRTWTPETIAAIHPRVRIPVVRSFDGIAANIPGTPDQHEIVQLELTEAVRQIRHPEPPEARYFVMQLALKALPLLALDFELPREVKRDRLMNSNLWMGADGITTPLHWDLANNVLACIHGRKRVLLFGPEQSENLYPVAASDPRYHHRSHVNLERPDFERFPRIARARPLGCVLEPGELLFLPPLWWHHVTSVGVSISLNIWWKPLLDQCRHDLWLRQLPLLFAGDRLQGFPRLVDLEGYPDLAAVALSFLATGPSWAAVLLAEAARLSTPVPEADGEAWRQLVTEAMRGVESNLDPATAALLVPGMVAAARARG